MSPQAGSGGDARSRGRVSTDSWGWGGRREKTLQKEHKSKRGLLGGVEAGPPLWYGPRPPSLPPRKEPEKSYGRNCICNLGSAPRRPQRCPGPSFNAARCGSACAQPHACLRPRTRKRSRRRVGPPGGWGEAAGGRRAGLALSARLPDSAQHSVAPQYFVLER